MNWLPHTISNDEFKLPKRPGIKHKRVYADLCARCKCVHMSVDDAVRCREMANEQK